MDTALAEKTLHFKFLPRIQAGDAQEN